MSTRPLHIGVDGRELLGQPTGVGRYLSSLLQTWAADASHPHRYTIFLPTEPAGELFHGASRTRPSGLFAETRVIPAAHAGTWWEQMLLPRAVAETRPDVFFAPGYTAPLRLRVPSVVAIHDVSFAAHPEWFRWREGLRRRWLTRAAGRRARTVITISEFSAAEIGAHLGVPRDRIVVSPVGVTLPAPPPVAPTREPLVLFVGSLFNRRRIPEMLKGFAEATPDLPAARLVIVGGNRTVPSIDPLAIAYELGIAQRTEWHRYVTDDALDELYWRARVFVFLSDYEGFAMTPMEALAHDVPAVMLDTPVAREIYEGAARLVSPAPDDIAHAIRSLLEDERAHAAGVAAGRMRVRDFTWTKAAATVRHVLEAAANTP